MMRVVLLLAALMGAMGFAPMPMMRGAARGAASKTELSMALKDGEKVIVIGVAADSGCVVWLASWAGWLGWLFGSRRIL